MSICACAARVPDYDTLDRYVKEGIVYCVARDLDLHANYLRLDRACGELDRCRWDATEESVGRVLRDRRAGPEEPTTALTLLGLVRARPGDPEVWQALGAASELCGPGMSPNIWVPLASARAEALCLEDGLVVGPYGAMLAGRWIDAVDQWQALGCRYEAALAAIDSGDGELLEWALGVLRELGATPAAAIAGRSLRELGR